MGSAFTPTARFEGTIHYRGNITWHTFESIVEGLLWMSESVDKAPDGDYCLGTIRDARGVLVAACDNRGRTWTQADGPAATIAGWRTS